MRWGALLFVLGWLALVVQGAASTLLPPPYCPDLGLLVVIAVGLTWERASSGLLLAFAIGLTADMLSGSLLGQHALLRLVAYLASRLASRQLNLRGALPLAVFAGAFTVLDALLVLALTSFFTGSGALGLEWVVDALQHGLVNAALAPAVSVGVERLGVWSGADDGSRRPLRLEPRGSKA
ncbi:MAG: rod shape-determining protein MreD [Myxococcota bacterium]